MTETGCQGGGGRANWRFLTNHSAVLLRIARDPDIRLADVASDVGLSQRAAQMILRDLVDGGFVTRHRVGRRNSYEIHRTRLLRPGGRLRVSDLLDLLPADYEWPAPARS
ncbi:MAG TPA: winged helix-turn-helix domain-containing protein [Gaiellales bacterium]|nr:winged helix-turn-helix domain-containing protein [Gaiellales bacterium]